MRKKDAAASSTGRLALNLCWCLVVGAMILVSVWTYKQSGSSKLKSSLSQASTGGQTLEKAAPSTQASFLSPPQAQPKLAQSQPMEEVTHPEELIQPEEEHLESSESLQTKLHSSGDCGGATLESVRIEGAGETVTALANAFWVDQLRATKSRYSVAFEQGRVSALHIHGRHGDSGDLRGLKLVVNLLVQGAVMRSTEEHMCRLVEKDLNMPRSCKLGRAGEAFIAVAHFYVPAVLPKRGPSDELRRWATGIHNWSQKLPSDLGGSLVEQAYKLVENTVTQAGVLWQVQGSNLISVFNTLIRSFAEVPKPFTMLEVGNFCGATTVGLAFLKKKLCPDCTFITIDPRLQVQNTQYKYMDNQCEAAQLVKKAKVDDAVHVVLQFGAETPIGDVPPIGFIFYDDGKIREANSPQHAFFEPRIMQGAYLAFDDWHQKHQVKGHPDMKVSDHQVFGEELVSTGAYEMIQNPLPGSGLGIGVLRKHMQPGLPHLEARASLLGSSGDVLCGTALRAVIDQ